jgi:phage terminase large subunit GpA-like protein
MNTAESLASSVSRLWAPPPRLSLSEWADTYFHLSSEYSAKQGKWTTLPYQREPLDSISDPLVKRTVIKAGRQMLKSLAIMTAVGYFSHQDPCPILVVQPGQEDAESFSKERIAPMVRDNPVLSAIFAESKGRNSANTVGQKQFPGGGLSIVGAGSPRTVARRTIRVLCFDEIDKYKPTSEGNVISIGRHCLTTFRHRAKEIDTCTPTVQGSNIDRAYEESDQRELFIPCASCGHRQSMMGQFHKQVRFDSSPLLTREEKALTARYHCEACDAAWTDADRMAGVERGEWRAKKPFQGIAGFWISQLYSPWKALSEIVLEFLTKKDDTLELQTFVNCTLAENWNEPGEQLEWERLVDRREEYAVGTVPEGGLFLAAGVDVQRENGGRLEVRVNAYGENRERWAIDYRIFPGDPGDPKTWEPLESMLRETWTNPRGAELPIERMFVDSGDGTVTPFVYDWVRQQARPRVWAIKGDRRSDQPVGPAKAVELTVGGKKLKYGVVFKIVQVDYFKAQIYADLRKRKPTEEERQGGMGFPQGYFHMPADPIFGDEHCRQICSEQLVTRRNKRGRTVTEWEQTRPRNEGLDTAVYADAAAFDFGSHRFQPKHWLLLKEKLRALEPDAVAKAAPPPAAPPNQPGDSWLGSRGKSWFNR